MKTRVFSGSGVAIVTPFGPDGSVNYEEFGRLIDWQIEQGTDCIIAAGTTGEASAMPDEEHIAVVEFAVKHTAGRVPVMAGAGSNDTRHGIHLAKCMVDVGADALLLVTPYYNKTTQKGLYEHFAATVQDLSIPVVLYNVPSRTGLNMLPATVARLARDFEQIVGVKECVFDQVGELKSLLGDDFSIYTGEDAVTVPVMAMGGTGVISVLANLVPADVHQMVRLCQEGRYPEAAAMQVKALPLIKALFSETSPIPVKYAMNRLGMSVGDGRLPLTTITDEGAARMDAALRQYGLLSE